MTSNTPGLGKIDQHLSNLYQSGIARLNRFEVEIFPPAIPGLYTQPIIQSLKLACQSANIASQTIATFESQINGNPVFQLPYQFSFGNTLDLTFKLSTDFRERNIFLIWQNLIYSPGQGFSYYNEYLGTIVLYSLDLNLKQRQKVTFRNAFPVTIQDINFDWGADGYATQGISFSFYAAETEILDPERESNPRRQNFGLNALGDAAAPFAIV